MVSDMSEDDVLQVVRVERTLGALDKDLDSALELLYAENAVEDHAQHVCKVLFAWCSFRNIYSCTL